MTSLPITDIAEEPADGTLRVALAGTCLLPTAHGAFRMEAYEVSGLTVEVTCLIAGQPERSQPALVRLHSECLTGDAFGSLRCDCGEQLNESLRLVQAEGSGAILYLRQEGRGIGLLNKVRAYELQDHGLDTVDANLALGLPVDGREYVSSAAVLRQLGLTRIRLLTNNPDKVEALEANGIEVVERVPLMTRPSKNNLRYLRTKATKMGHQLTLLNGHEVSRTDHGDS